MIYNSESLIPEFFPDFNHSHCDMMCTTTKDIMANIIYQKHLDFANTISWSCCFHRYALSTKTL